MKRFIDIYVPIIIAIVTLVFIANIQLGATQESKEIPKMGTDRLFVKVKEDAFLKAIKTAYNGKVRVSNNTNFIITSPNGYLIDSATTAQTSDIELLNKVASNRFECKSSNNEYTISLKKEDGYVDCPVVLLTPILQELKNKGVTQ